MKSLMQYIQGSRKGKEAHRLEKEAMKDPFLSDALDGFQTVEGNHVESIEEMRRRISRRTRSHRDSITKWSIAASLLICLGFGSYFWLDRPIRYAVTVTAGGCYGGTGGSVTTSTVGGYCSRFYART